MTSVTEAALARRNASIQKSSSMKLSLAGKTVDWTMKTCRPRTFWPIRTKTLPSENFKLCPAPGSMPRNSQIADVSRGLPDPPKTRMSSSLIAPPVGDEEPAESRTGRYPARAGSETGGRRRRRRRIIAFGSRGPDLVPDTRQASPADQVELPSVQLAGERVAIDDAESCQVGFQMRAPALDVPVSETRVFGVRLLVRVPALGVLQSLLGEALEERVHEFVVLPDAGRREPAAQEERVDPVDLAG